MFSYRQYQIEAANNVLTDLDSYSKLALILPTRAGKTEIFIRIIDKWLVENPNKSVLILSHVDLLTTQTKNRINLRTPHISVGILQGRITPDPFDRVIISTMQTARSSTHTNKLDRTLFNPVGLIVIDECHYLYTSSYEKVLNHYADVPVVGCTATPFRQSKLITGFFDKISYSISIRELIQMGFLVPPKLHQIVRTSREVSDIVSLVANIYLKREAPRKSIIYMQKIEDAKLMRNVLYDAGIQARAVTGELVGAYRQEILDDFLQGDTQVLCTCDVLTAGFDAPNIESIFMPYATKSPTRYLQRAGRGLTPCPEINKSECRIYAFGDAPSISRDLYRKLEAKILNAGSQKPKEHKTYMEDWEYNDYDPSTEIYIWNQQVVDTIKHMRKIGMSRMARYLNEKKFPPKFMKNIKEILDSLPKSKIWLRDGQMPITDKQRFILSKHGFTLEQLCRVTKAEASGMISGILGSAGPDNRFVIKSGIHQGKHIRELPHAYRTIVLKKYPASPVATLIREWIAEQKSRRNSA